MKIKLITIAILITVCLPLLASNLSALKIKLHTASRAIDNSIDRKALVNSIYQQIRPRTQITNKQLTKQEIDAKVFNYVKEKYLPALIKNYAFLYAKLTNAHKDFSECQHPQAIEPKTDVLTTLCLNQEANAVEVIYLTNGYQRGWKKSLVFSFTPTDSSLLLSAIDLQLKKDVQSYIEGL